MAGGIGSRLWPISKKNNPKQFIDIVDRGLNLFQESFKRLNKICFKKNIYIVTNQNYKYLVKKSVKIHENQILCEPMMKNTAACIAYATYKIHHINRNANLIISPSDHLIKNQSELFKILNKAINHVSRKNILMTLGISITRPDTNYGYIEYNQNNSNNIYEVKRFTEKPDLKTAKKFIKKENYLWNSGIFIWNSKTIINSFRKNMKYLHESFSSFKYFFETDKEKKFIEKLYKGLNNISIDYGILEKEKNVFVMKCDFEWNDLGTYKSIFSVIKKENHNNAILGKNIKIFNSKNNLIFSRSNRNLIIDGLKDYILIDTNDSLLLIKRENEHKLKEYIKEIS